MTPKILWQSNYGLMSSEGCSEAWDASVTAFSDGSFDVDIAQPGDDLHKKFTSVQSAYNWVSDFTAGKHLELCPSCEFDFREIVY